MIDTPILPEPPYTVGLDGEPLRLGGLDIPSDDLGYHHRDRLPPLGQWELSSQPCSGNFTSEHLHALRCTEQQSSADCVGEVVQIFSPLGSGPGIGPQSLSHPTPAPGFVSLVFRCQASQSRSPAYLPYWCLIRFAVDLATQRNIPTDAPHMGSHPDPWGLDRFNCALFGSMPHPLPLRFRTRATPPARTSVSVICWLQINSGASDRPSHSCRCLTRWYKGALFGCILPGLTPFWHSPHHPFQWSLWPSSTLYVPNTCIGGSGAGTAVVDLGSCLGCLTPSCCISGQAVPSTLLWSLLSLGCFLVPLARSILLLLGLGLFAMLGKALPGRHTPLGNLAFLPSAGLPWAFAHATGGIGRPVPVLDWRCRPRLRPRRKLDISQPSEHYHCWWSRVLYLLSGSIPMQIWEPHPHLPQLQVTGLFVSPGFFRIFIVGSLLCHASAMTAPHSSHDGIPFEPEPLPLPPEEPATYQGLSWTTAPLLGPSHSPDVIRLESQPQVALSQQEGPWLGVEVHTPHYRSVSVACRVPAGTGLHHVSELVRIYSGGVPPGIFDVVTPVRPQRFPEFAEFIRLPHIIRYQPGMDSAAVMLDLTRVGGNYFPFVLPRLMGHQAFLDFVQDHIRVEADSVFVFVGMKPTPWPRSEPFHFRDGDAIILSTHRNAQVQDSTACELFHEGARWGPIENLPKLHPSLGVYILHDSVNYYMANWHHSGVGTAKAVGCRPPPHVASIHYDLQLPVVRPCLQWTPLPHSPLCCRQTMAIHGPTAVSPQGHFCPV